ncbi:hypothetical protein WI61_36160 [Burkholderia cepacia]|uniref:hypothetical protein n=1 Tax=Burkholderia cepacia TaxID=292 RepID=UPI00075E1162|nr:hypothetical protein [Burkholderia cepacia]KVA56770.1 hypothetical protein WI49_31245 [Burkholderia cepacia]KVA67088.1 hypothetical protein WI48_03790 [Burkholderia cepacia]KVA80148.1 hypothetical protein WI52_23025 [Burkholderia cepacia]KVA92279.1 hypothetical protein WI50_05720 [Burkholderia cepacia]KVA96351.1 hypothetical protein WI51_36325 [Burkholderia cepacia]
MMPWQVVQSLEALTNAIEAAVARADWAEAVRAAETRSRFVLALAPDQPDEVVSALGRMQETDVRISIVARETLQALVAEGWAALHETRAATHALQAGQRALDADAAASRYASRADTRFALRH